MTKLIHVSRKHSEKFECELCKYEAQDLENLDLHMFTCEMYRCEKCDYKCNSISDIRTHINKVHGNANDKRDVFLEHFKQCRKNSDEITKSRHWSIRLFPEIKNYIYTIVKLHTIICVIKLQHSFFTPTKFS